MSHEIRQFVESCEVCASFPAPQAKQPIISHDMPTRAWQKVGSDIFSIFDRNYLLLVDYFSDFIEIDFLPDIRARTVIHKTKAHFARHGIPELLITDSGTQYTADEFANFAKQWNFRHHPSSPLNHSSNGKAENAVKIVKSLMRKCHERGDDHYLGLLNLRNTPTEGLDVSPAQRLFNRRTNSLIPAHNAKLKPDNCVVSQKLEIKKMKSILKTTDRKPLPKLQPGDDITFKANENSNKWRKGKISKQLNPKSYEIFSGDKLFRRTRQHIKKINMSQPPTMSVTGNTDIPQTPQIVARNTKRTSRPPERLTIVPFEKSYY